MLKQRRKGVKPCRGSECGLWWIDYEEAGFGGPLRSKARTPETFERKVAVMSIEKFCKQRGCR